MLHAVRSYALEQPCPEPPAGAAWIASARDSQVLSTVLSAISSAGWSLTDDLQSGLLAGSATSLRTEVELRAVAAALDPARVRWAALKGPVLGDVVYRRPGIRDYDDLDVLVDSRDLGRALHNLTDAGFELLDRNWTMISATMRGEISLLGRTGTVLDLHWHPINEPRIRRAFSVDVRSMLERREPVRIGGVTVPTLAAEDVVMTVALHAALSGGHRLKWLLDLHQALQWARRSPEEIAQRAEHHGLALVVGVMIDRVVDHLDPGLAPFSAAVAPRRAWRLLCAEVSKRHPPVAAELPRRTGRSMFAATRTGPASSTRALVTDRVASLRHRMTPLKDESELDRLRSPGGDDSDRDAWFAHAAGTGSGPATLTAGG